jgi:serine/threonine protein kinase
MSQYRDSFVNFIGWYETDIHVCIAMDFHELGSLDQYLAPTHAPLPESETKVITEQVLKALDYMHGLQFMHRDLKPAVCLSPSMLQDLHQLTCSRSERSGSHYRTSMLGETRRLQF